MTIFVFDIINQFISLHKIKVRLKKLVGGFNILSQLINDEEEADFVQEVIQLAGEKPLVYIVYFFY
jgi:hypothetical protein